MAVAKTVSPASRARTKLMEEVENGSFIEPKNLSLREYLDTWLKEKALYVRPTTLNNITRGLNVILENGLGNVPVQRLTARQIRIIALDLVENGRLIRETNIMFIA